MDIKEKIQQRYCELKKELEDKDILSKYDYLNNRFNKAFNCQFDIGSKAHIEIEAIIKILAETEAEIKFN